MATAVCRTEAFYLQTGMPGFRAAETAANTGKSQKILNPLVHLAAHELRVVAIAHHQFKV